MKVFLSVVWYRVLPPRYGGQKGIALFNQYLGKKIQLTCLCSQDNIPGKDLSYNVVNDLPVSRFQFWNPLTRKKILSFIRRQGFTHIIIEHPYHAWLGKYKNKPGFRFIVHAHNIEWLRMKARGKPWWRMIKGMERKAFAVADHILFKTEHDRTTAIEQFGIPPGKCMVVPYGVEEREQPVTNSGTRQRLMEEYNIAPNEKILLFAGSLDYKPNIDALKDISEHIIPLLNRKQFYFRLLVCGAIPVSEGAALSSAGKIVIAGFVPSIKDYMRSADVFINPVIAGSGIQTKNIEAIANGCNVVTTVFGATGLPPYIINTKLFISANGDWEGFADNIILASSVNAVVPRQFYDDYNWQNIIDRFLEKTLAEE